MTTVGNLVDRVFREYLSPADEQPIVTQLDSGVDDAVTDLTLDVSLLTPEEREIPGKGLVIEVGQEQMLLTSYVVSTGSAEVKRGWNGTEAAAHSAGDTITIIPTYSRAVVFDAVADEIVSLHPDLWGLDMVEKVSSRFPLDVDADVVGVAAVTWDAGGGHLLSGRGELFRIPSGKKVSLSGIPAGKTVYLTLKKDFPRPTAETDVLADLNVNDEWAPIIVLGAVARITPVIDQQRLHLDWAIEQQMAELAPSGTSSSLALRMKGLRDRWVTDAAERLNREYPPVITYSSPFRPNQRV